MSVRILIAESNLAFQREMREIVHVGHDFEIVGTALDGEEAVQLPINHQPDIALIDYHLPGITGLQTCEILSAIAPDVMPVIVTDSATREMTDDCMRFGARAVVGRPLDPDRLFSLILEIANIRKRRSTPDILHWGDTSEIPHIVSVSGAKGGIGKSTIAVNLAVSLSKMFPERVSIVDFYNQFGDVPTMFNIVPKGTIADLAPIWRELDLEIIDNYITRHASGVHILSMSMKPISPDAIPIECLDAILYILKRRYKFIVLDVPISLHESILHIFSRSSLIVLVSNLMDLTTVTDTHRFYEALREEDISRESVGIVLNRTSKSDTLKADYVEKMFDCRMLAHIPNDDRVTATINEGFPLVASDPSCRFAQGIGALAEAVIEPPKRIDRE